MTARRTSKKEDKKNSPKCPPLLVQFKNLWGKKGGYPRRKCSDGTEAREQAPTYIRRTSKGWSRLCAPFRSIRSRLSGKSCDRPDLHNNATPRQPSAMSMESSFQVAPHCMGAGGAGGGAVSSRGSSATPRAHKSSEVTANQAKKGEGEQTQPMAPKSILKTTTRAGDGPAAQQYEHQGVVQSGIPTTSETTAIPGTWGMALSSRHPGGVASRTIRASPFEPLVHNRKLPRDGTISPLRIDEYYAYYQQDRLQLPTLHQTAAATGPSGAVGGGPPVHEIRIPTPHQQDDSLHSICSAVGETAASYTEEHYKNLYFSSQRELHATHGKAAQAMEENRLLKRHLIEMQKQLFSVTRNKRSTATGGVQNTAWSIPSSSVIAASCSKRPKFVSTTTSTTTTTTKPPLDHQYHHHHDDDDAARSPDSLRKTPLSTISETSTMYGPSSASVSPKSSSAITKSVSSDAAF